MGISKSRLSHSPTGFHRFVPSRAVQPLEQINLEVVFVDYENLRLETIRYEFMSFRMGYNTILGRPAYVKVIALTLYAYLQLKMSGPNDTITVHGSTEKRSRQRSLTSRPAELEEIHKSIDPSTTTLPRKSKPGPAF